MVEFVDDDLRGARLHRVDLSDSRWHGVVLSNVKITDAWVENVDLDCYLGGLTVNGVDVTGYVRDQLDARYPERRMLAATDADGLRAAWAMIQAHAEATLARARALPDTALDESVDGEYSYLQTLRHLVFATDRWITGPVLAVPAPLHPLGLPHDGASEGPADGLDIAATPSLDEVLAARRGRMASVTELLRAPSDDDLNRIVGSPNGGTTSVRSCIHVVLDEEWAHNRYANRDLDALGAPPAS